MCHNTEEWCKIWGKTDFEKMTWEIWGILTSALGSLKICILMGSFWAKYIMYELKNCAGHDNEGWCNVLIKKLIGGLKNDLKVVSATFVLVYFLSLNESTCQTRKNVFYFTSKALFVLEKIKF